MELLVVQYCREDADSNKKKSPTLDKNAKVMRFLNFRILTKLLPNFYGTQFVGVKIMGEKKKF